jgi:hypoxanthine-DNA glycosylase
MPGEASLRAAQYYAHPRNAFWRIMGELVGAGPELCYPDRLRALTSARIALWDVLAACERPGSLDSAIRNARPNDFAAFFAAHAGIAHVFFNGARAESLFLGRVLPGLGSPAPRLRRLPSTSPANAGMSFERRLEAWQVVRDELPRL